MTTTAPAPGDLLQVEHRGAFWFARLNRPALPAVATAVLSQMRRQGLRLCSTICINYSAQLQMTIIITGGQLG